MEANKFLHESEKATPETSHDFNKSQEYVAKLPESFFYKGVLFLGDVESELAFNQFDKGDMINVRDDDIWIVTYPKSGTTWMGAIVSMICLNGDVSRISGGKLDDFLSFLDFRNESQNVSEQLESLRNKCRDEQRIISTHFPLKCLPREVRESLTVEGDGKLKLIYVVRNPADVAVSYFYFHPMAKMLGNQDIPFSTFLDLFMKGLLAYGDWFEHARPYYALSNHLSTASMKSQVMFVSYEQLIVDLPKMVGKIARFIGKDLSERQINEIAECCSFEKMKNNNDLNKYNDQSYFDYSKSRFMRKGEIGDWMNHFSDEDKKSFFDWYSSNKQDIQINLAFTLAEARENYQLK